MKVGDVICLQKTKKHTNKLIAETCVFAEICCNIPEWH